MKNVTNTHIYMPEIMEHKTDDVDVKPTLRYQVKQLTNKVNGLHHDLAQKDEIILLQVEAMKKMRARIDELEGGGNG